MKSKDVIDAHKKIVWKVIGKDKVIIEDIPNITSKSKYHLMTPISYGIQTFQFLLMHEIRMISQNKDRFQIL